MPRNFLYRTGCALYKIMNYKIALVIFLVFVGLLIILPSYEASHTEEEYMLTINDIDFSVEVADTPEKRAQGLSGREFLPEDEGLLFVFNNSGTYSFWMKEMNFPIDIIWIDENFVIEEITKNIAPETFPETFSSQNPAQYVLEINAGLSEKYNFQKGDPVLLKKLN